MLAVPVQVLICMYGLSLDCSDKCTMLVWGFGCEFYVGAKGVRWDRNCWVCSGLWKMNVSSTNLSQVLEGLGEELKALYYISHSVIDFMLSKFSVYRIIVFLRLWFQSPP